jgi:hypothetical protein
MNSKYVLHIFIMVGLLTLFCIATVAYAQDTDATEEPADTTGEESTESEGLTIPIQRDIDSSGLVRDISNKDFWLAMIIAFIAGLIGGFISELIQTGGMIEMPGVRTSADIPAATIAFIGKRSKLYDLGVVSRLIIGGGAGVISIYFLTPDTAWGLLVVALISGSAGTSVFRNAQERLNVSLSQKNLETADNTITLQQEKIKQLEEIVTTLSQAQQTPETSPSDKQLNEIIAVNNEDAARDTYADIAASTVKPQGEHIQQAQKIIEEAKAIGEVWMQMQKKS